MQTKCSACSNNCWWISCIKSNAGLILQLIKFLQLQVRNSYKNNNNKNEDTITIQKPSNEMIASNNSVRSPQFNTTYKYDIKYIDDK